MALSHLWRSSNALPTLSNHASSSNKKGITLEIWSDALDSCAIIRVIVPLRDFRVRSFVELLISSTFPLTPSAGVGQKRVTSSLLCFKGVLLRIVSIYSRLGIRQPNFYFVIFLSLSCCFALLQPRQSKPQPTHRVHINRMQFSRRLVFPPIQDFVAIPLLELILHQPCPADQDD